MNKTLVIIIVIIIIIIIIGLLVYLFNRNNNKCKDNNTTISDQTSCSNKSQTPNKNSTPDVNGLRISNLVRQDDGNFVAFNVTDSNMKPDIVVLNPNSKGGMNFTELINCIGLTGVAGIKKVENGIYLAGNGTTIAIVSPYINPNIKQDLILSLVSQNGILHDNSNATVLANKISSNLTILYNNNAINSSKNSEAWGIEQSLEIQTIMNLCPGAKVYLIQARSESVDDMVDAIEVACNPDVVNAQIVNLGWGGNFNCLNEDSNIEAGSCDADQIFAKYPNIIFCASAGMAGTQWPMVNPYVIAVGGVSVANEELTAWSQTGGGPNANYPGSTFQNTVYPNPIPRLTPDIASIADPECGVNIYYNGINIVVGGNSLSTTIFSAFFNLVNSYRIMVSKSYLTQLEVQNAIYGDKFSGVGGEHNPYLVCVIQGQNKNFTASTGYDCLTGMGVHTPSFFHLLIKI